MARNFAFSCILNAPSMEDDNGGYGSEISSGHDGYCSEVSTNPDIEVPALNTSIIASLSVDEPLDPNLNPVKLAKFMFDARPRMRHPERQIRDSMLAIVEKATLNDKFDDTPTGKSHEHIFLHRLGPGPTLRGSSWTQQAHAAGLTNDQAPTYKYSSMATSELIYSSSRCLWAALIKNTVLRIRRHELDGWNCIDPSGLFR
jgi:hypothetical protein